MLSKTDDLDLSALHLVTRFILDDDGRIVCENAPDRAATPRLYLEGCRSGNLARVSHDVEAETAHAIAALAADEPPFCDPEQRPVHFDEYQRLLDPDALVRRWGTGLVWTFPEGFAYSSDVPLVGSETPDGERLLAGIRERGMPAPLVVLGYRGVEDFWAPWCVALHAGEAAAVAITARLGPAGAEVGVATVPALRGRGYAAAAVAGWAALPALRGRRLFYSTQRQNLSSRRVAARLGLRYRGASFAIS